MAWENPVTTWGQAGKTVPGAGDFNRIEGNTQYLKDEVDSHKAEDASTTAKGHVQLNNTVTSTSTTQAATANAVQTVNDALTSHKAENASTTTKGHVQLSSSTSSTSTSLAATASAVKTVNDALTSHKAENASTTTKGHVQLSSSTSSTSTSLAATASAVKTVNDALTSHKTAAAPHSGHETPAGAQAKADAAAGAVQAELNTHKADGASHSKTARFVIGTSTSGWTEKDCDYLCDGTKDQIEINNAIQALPATGGEIVILDGTYNITAKINVNKNNVSIRGNGNATILKRMFNSSTAEGVITLTNRSGCKIANLQIDGNGAEYTDSNNNGIYLTSSSNNTITGNACNNNSSHGIYLASSSNNTITGNACNNNSSNNGILLSASSNNTVTSNTCNNNNAGIYTSSSSNNNTVTGNTYNHNNYVINLRSSNNTVTGNACNNNNNSGIYLLDSSNNTVTGNICIRGTGLAGDYTTSQHTIRLYGTGNSYNLIAMNNCMGKAVTNGGGTGNTLVNNKFDAS